MNSAKTLKFSNRFIELGVIFLVIFTPLAFGSVHIWAYSIMELGVILLVGMWIIKRIAGRRLLVADQLTTNKTPLLNLLVTAFAGLLLFQLIPLPEAVMKYVSPHTYDLYQAVLPEYGVRGSDAAAGVPGRRPKPVDLKSDWRPISVYPYATRLELFKFLSYVGLFYLIIRNITTRKQINRLVVVIMLVGCFEAVYGLLEYLSGHQYIFFYKKKYYTDCASGTFVNRNHFAGYLELVISLSLGMVIYQWLKLPESPIKGIRGFFNRLASERGSKLTLSVFAVSIMVLGVILSQSRMGIFSMLAALAVMSVLLMWNMRSKIIFKLISIVLVVGISAGMWLGVNPVISRFSLLP